jgi:hypothetical protein
MPAEPRGTVLVPFKSSPGEIPPAYEVKSTLLTASVEAVKQRGRFEEYDSRLTPEAREAIHLGVAGRWLSMEIALTHYASLDALAFTDHEIFDNGRVVGTRINNTFLGIVLKLAGTAGTTPWTPLEQTGKLFERVFRGGGLQMMRLGPKEARIDVVALPVMTSSYFRAALRGQVVAGCELFCKRAYVRELERATNGSGSFRVSWV